MKLMEMEMAPNRLDFCLSSLRPAVGCMGIFELFLMSWSEAIEDMMSFCSTVVKLCFAILDTGDVLNLWFFIVFGWFDP